MSSWVLARITILAVQGAGEAAGPWKEPGIHDDREPGFSDY
jgi:hypothetical protein